MPEKSHLSLLATYEPSNFEEAWIGAMNEELDQVENNDTWELVA